MSLQKESADAFRQCLRILAPRHTPEERRIQIRNVETYIAMGKWIPALRIKQIALLFYPYDSPLELAMLSKMEKAIEAQELIPTPNEKDALMVADLAAWPDCPPVPQDSPLRYWLPDWMQTAQGTRAIPTRQQTAATPAPVVAVGASGDVEQTADAERRLTRLRALGGTAKYVRYEWKFTGMADLVESEKADGRKRRSEKTIRADLRQAAQAERDEKNAGFGAGLGQR